MSLTTRPKQSIYHKKTKGEHHRHNKHYLKTYSPYLPLFLLIIVGLAINTLWSSRIGVLGATTNLSAQELLVSTNNVRSEYHQDDLRINQSLSIAAQSKAHDMVTKNYWSHNTPDGHTPWTFVSASGYKYQAAAENLAYGFTNAQSTLTGWMNSPEHRANVLNQDYKEVGFGMATANNFVGHGRTTVIVAFYGTPVSGDFGNSTSSASTGSSNSSTAAPLRTVSRIQLLTGGQAPWSFTLISLLSLGALALFVYRHARIWHKVLVHSEEFVFHHKMLDVVIISFSVAGYVLTRAAGYIQ